MFRQSCPIVRVAMSAPTRSDAAICSIVITFKYARFAEMYSTATATIPITNERSRFRAGSRTSPATKLT